MIRWCCRSISEMPTLRASVHSIRYMGAFPHPAGLQDVAGCLPGSRSRAVTVATACSAVIPRFLSLPPRGPRTRRFRATVGSNRSTPSGQGQAWRRAGHSGNLYVRHDVGRSSRHGARRHSLLPGECRPGAGADSARPRTLRDDHGGPLTGCRHDASTSGRHRPSVSSCAVAGWFLHPPSDRQPCPLATPRGSESSGYDSNHRKSAAAENAEEHLTPGESVVTRVCRLAPTLRRRGRIQDNDLSETASRTGEILPCACSTAVWHARLR